MKKSFFSSLFVPLFISNYLLCGCGKGNNSASTKENNETTADDTNKDKSNQDYCSLIITTNIPTATNYATNVDDLNKIEKGKEVTIHNTSGYYLIKQILSSNNELLSTENNYSFQITQNTEIKLIFVQSNKYFISPKENGDANIILMCGQSNMAGSETKFSLLDQSTIEKYKKGHDNVMINYHANTNYTFQTELSGDFTYVDFGQGNALTTFGPEMGLAKSLGTYRKNEKYYLVKVAYGGTNLHTQWNVDNINVTEFKYMYGRFVKYLNNVLDMFKTSTTLTPKIRAMMWLQGESDTDTDSGSHAVEYPTHFQKLINDVKTRYADYLSSDFKWISALISTTYNNNQNGATTTNIGYVNDALRTYSDRIVTETESELEKISKHHYTPQSSLKIGEYFYREFAS